MDNFFEIGLAKRKATLGAAFVEAELAKADDFSRPYQEAITAWCWGFGWGDETIDAKTRSMMNLTMIAALGKMTEWERHLKGALTNGVSRDEVRAILHVIGIYCGVPQGVECFRVAKKVFAEADAAEMAQKADVGDTPTPAQETPKTGKSGKASKSGKESKTGKESKSFKERKGKPD